MFLRCPHCRRTGEHVRSDFFGDWVVCPVCELPFAWREAQAGGDGVGPPQPGPNGAGKNRSRGQRSPTRSKR